MKSPAVMEDAADLLGNADINRAHDSVDIPAGRPAICRNLTWMVKLNRAMKPNDIYLNEFHRRQYEHAKRLLSKRPRQSLADVMKQYDRIKRGSTRTRPRFANAMKGETD